MKIYAARVYEVQAAETGQLCGLLDSGRRKMTLELKNAKARDKSIFAGLLLRYAFLQAGYTAGAWERITIEKESYGKPYIKGYPDFQYSLSHSGEWVVCAVDTAPVGADIQEMKDWKMRLAERFYHKDEYNRLLALGESDIDRRTREFYAVWTAKESVVKLSGRGIGAGISQYLTSPDYSRVYDMDSGQSIGIRLYGGLAGYMVCVCSRTGIFPEKPEVVDFGTIDFGTKDFRTKDFRTKDFGTTDFNNL